MSYDHGIGVKEAPTSIPTPAQSTEGVTVIFGTAPVNLAADPAHAANKLFLCRSFEEAKAALGYSEDYSKYTLCQAMDAFFKVFAVAPVVLCNVLDPSSATHKETMTQTSATVTNDQAVLTEDGIIMSTLTFKNGSTDLVIDEDYTLAFNDAGKVVVTLLTTVATLTVAGYKLKPSGVTLAEVIGSIDANTDTYTGIQLVDKVYPELHVAPGAILAPGWSHNPSVGLALAAKCEQISGLFRTECIVDIDCGQTNSGALKYSDVETVKNNSGYADVHMIALWPEVKAAGKQFAYSAIFAAMMLNTDLNNGDIPTMSPSNKLLRINGTCLHDGTPVNLEQKQANELNGIGVVTAIYFGGYKSWGNNTAAYPSVSEDPKDRWIACRRFFSWWGNRFILTYASKVDDPTNYRMIQSIVDDENIFGNSLFSEGKVGGAKISYNQDDNPIESILAGKIKFKQFLAPYPPAEYIENVLEFDPSMLQTALGGE